MDSAQLAIVLLNWNGYKETVACVDSLLKNTTSFSFDIYIIDNGSKGNDASMLTKRYGKASQVVVISSNKNLGFTGGNNFLIEVAQKRKNYDYYFLLNNDTEVPAGFLETFMRAVGNRSGVFGPQVRYFGQPTLLQSIGGRINLWTGICSRLGDKVLAEQCPQKNIERETDYIFGAAFLISHDVVVALGGLHEEFFIYYEEVDYCVLVKRKGFSVRYVPVEMILHKDSVSTKKMTGFHIYMMWRNRIHFMRRHASMIQYIFSFVYLFAYLPYFTVKYGITEAKFLIAGTIDGLRGKKGNAFLYRTF